MNTYLLSSGVGRALIAGVVISLMLMQTANAGGVKTGAAAQSSGTFFSDEQLDTDIRKISLGLSFKHGLTVNLKASVKNRSGEVVEGPVRIAVKTNGNVLKADGKAQDGAPLVYVCKMANCELTSGAVSQFADIRLSFSLKEMLKHGITLKLRPEHVPFKLQLLHNADMDGSSGALENVKPFSAILAALKAEYPDNTLILSSGDNYIPGPRFSACADNSLSALIGIAGQGRCDIAFMNAMGYQASAVGNHDLDTGPAGFAAIINEQFAVDGSVYPGAGFPYLSSNLDFTTDTNLAGLVVDDAQPAETIPGSLAASAVINVAGRTIGIVGATTPTLARITSTGNITISPADATDIPALAAEIQQAVDSLTMMGINKIIVLAHMQQIAVERQLATLLSDVDIILAGGSNTLLADNTDRLRDGDVAADTYPLASTSASGEPVLVVNTDGDYKYLGRLVSAFDLSGHLIVESLSPAINGVYAADADGLSAAGNPAPNGEVVAIADALTAVLAERDGNIFGRTGVYLDGRRNQVRTQETNLGSLSADANLFIARQVDTSTMISIKNGGGIRDDIGFFAFPPGSTDPDDLQFFPPEPNPAAGKLSGDISQFDIQGALSFNNGLTLLTVTAAQLQAVIEHGVAASVSGATPGQFPQVGGLRFSFDPALPAISRVRNLVVTSNDGGIADIIVQNGVLIGDPARTFRLVTLNFMADGGDGYPFAAATDRIDLVGSGLIAEGVAAFAAPGSEQHALAEYIAAYYSVAPYAEMETPAALDERIQNLTARADTVMTP